MASCCDNRDAAARESDAWHAQALECLARHQPEEAERAARHAIALEPVRADFHAVLGRALNNQHRMEEAASALREAVRLDPDNGLTRRHLGHVARRLGALDVAGEAFREAARLAPADPLAHRGLGEVLYAQGRYRAAMASLRHALALAPADADARYNLALACHAEGEFEQAVEAYRKVLVCNPEHLEALTNLASAHRTLGELDQAEAGFRRALELDSQNAAALAGLAALLDLSGCTAQGLALLEAPAREPDAAADILLCRAELLQHSGRTSEAREALERLAARPDLSRQQRMVLDFSLCGLLDTQGDYERALERCAAANSAMHVRFDAAARSEAVDRLVGSFSAQAMSGLPRSQNDSELPVFIVGMPRSGTSLVEQILASHPDVRGAGELREIGRSVRNLALRLGRPWPECISLLDRNALDDLSARYVSVLAGSGNDARRVTDKMWQNFENLGFIELLLPRARVIHCRRDPLDTGLSCYFQSFALAGPPFSYDLAHIGTYYREYLRLMSHWRNVLRLDLLEVDYEHLVDDPEGQSRRLIAFLGLEWDPVCLDFYTNPRIVRTASSRQVREPIYARSVDRHRHYEKFLGPLRDALAGAGSAGRRQPRLTGNGAEGGERSAAEYVQAQHELAREHEERGEPDQAIARLERVLEANPDNAATHNNLGVIQLNRGDAERAVACFREAIRCRPDYATAYRNLGLALHLQSRFQDALAAFRHAVELEPDNAAAHAGVAAILQILGDVGQAAEASARAFELAPAEPGALTARAELLDADGRNGEALALLEPQIKGGRPAAEITLAWSRLLRRAGRHSEALEALKPALDEPRLTPSRRVQLEFELGYLHAALGDHARAFDHFCAANRAKPARFDPLGHSRAVDALIESFSAEALAALPRSASRSERPVFVVGMPRSGKSLVEQILACHPQVYGAGETRCLGEISLRLRDALSSVEPYPGCIRDATPGALTALAAEYLDRVGAGKGALRVTDTLPTNFLHIGLVELLFPHARIVHCVRDRRDVAWACFTRDFADSSFAFACDFEHIAAFHRNYERLMAHWRTASGLPLLEVRYEALVQDIETEARRLIAHLDLDWDARCLRYFEPDIPTLAQGIQVREPLNTREIGFHSPYASWMA